MYDITFQACETTAAKEIIITNDKTGV
jgi:hypothetical protein